MPHRGSTTVALVAIATSACTPGPRHTDRAAAPLPAVSNAGTVADAPPPKPDASLVVHAVPPGPVWSKTTVAYEVGPPDCVIRWTLERSGVNTGIATQYAHCTWPMDRQVALLSRLLATMREREPLFRRVHFIDISPPWPELTARLIVAANARGWDARHGRPADGRSLDVFLTELLQQGPPLVEWRALSAAQHLSVTADVDEIDVYDARDLPELAELAERGIQLDPQDKVIARFVLGLTFEPLP